MEFNLQSFLVLITFYCIGSIPFALIVHKLMATNDPRQLGSMNPGATNMFRIAGPFAGIATFLGDFLKGFIPVYVLTPESLTYGYMFSLSLLAGHMFSIFNSFKGGKGVATSFGFIIALNYTIGIAIILIWLFVFIIKRISGLSAILSFVSLPLIIYLMSDSFTFFLISIFHSLVILINHRNNIRELLQA
tara:strand:- start:14639 stop:15208 length:570 start_codon:yes stop_codon:yes gene_type:complete